MLQPLLRTGRIPEVARYQGWTAPYSIQSAEKLIRTLIESQGPQMNEYYTMAIVDPVDDELLGDLAMKWEWDGMAVEVGYTLARENQGKGYAFQALDTLLRYLFTATPLQRAQGSLHPDNYASARLLERSGFVYEGTTRMGYWVGGVGADDDRYGVLIVTSGSPGAIDRSPGPEPFGWRRSPQPT